MLRTGKNISHRKCNKFLGFPYSHKQNTTSKQTRHNYKRSQRENMRSNLFYISNRYTNRYKYFYVTAMRFKPTTT